MHWPHPDPMVTLGQTLGRLLEKSESTDRTVQEIRRDQIDIKDRLAHGDAKFATIETRIVELAVQVKKPEIGPWEKYSIEAVRVVLYLLVLWATGSIEHAAKLAGVK